MSESYDLSQALPFLIGGLALFLFSISRLSEEMKAAFGAKARAVIARYTRHLLSAVLIGAAVTVALGSSSAAIIIALIFINVGSLTFRQAIGIIMGANIGTTFSSQLIALDTSQYAYLLLAFGLALQLFFSKNAAGQWGRILFFFGLLFFSLFLIESSLNPLKGSELVADWMAHIAGDPLRGALAGGLATLLIQSSSATVGLAIVMARENLISLAGGIAVMLGAELGTCSDTLLATIGGTRQALKAGLFHFFFNLSTILAGLLFFAPFLQLVEWLAYSPGIETHLANAHLLFNLLGVLVFLPLVGSAERALNRLVPEKGGARDEQVYETPADRAQQVS